MRVIHDREFDSDRKLFSQQSEESAIYQIDFDRLMTERGSSVSTAVWSSKTASITDQSLASNIATATITSDRKTNLIKVIATQADGVKRIKHFTVKVIDPTVTGDY